jgi:polysaccharide pyruvyl transferase WcaK-like protein
MPNIITLPATSKYENSGKAGLTASTVHEINQYGHGVIVGGGNLYENSERDFDLQAIKRLDPPLMLFSLSRGRIHGRDDSLVERTDAMLDERIVALNERADISFSRDPATQTHLESLGITKSLMGACPTLFLSDIASRLPEVPNTNAGATFISIRAPELMNISLRRQAQVHGQVSSIYKMLAKSGYKNIQLLCHDSRDVGFAASFGEVPYIYQSDPYDFLSLIKSARSVISFRIHASIPAASFGTNFVNISYDERASSLMEAVGLKEWDLNLVESNDLTSDIQSRLETPHVLERLREERAQQWASILSLQSENMDHFFQLMSEYQVTQVASLPSSKKS